MTKDAESGALTPENQVRRAQQSEDVLTCTRPRLRLADELECCVDYSCYTNRVCHPYCSTVASHPPALAARHSCNFEGSCLATRCRLQVTLRA